MHRSRVRTSRNGNFERLCKASYYYLSIIPIKLFSIHESFWFAPDNWLVKEKRETINIDLSQFNIPPFYIPGNQKDVVSVITGVANHSPFLNKFALSQNYPNPFNPSTVISYQIPKAAFVKITVFNVLGKSIKTLVSKTQTSGLYNVNWYSDDNSGKAVSTGIYFYTISAQSEAVNFSSTKKCCF